MYKKLSLRLSKIEYSSLSGIKDLLQLRSHSKVSFQLILLSLIHLQTRSLRLTKKERSRLDYLNSKDYQIKRSNYIRRLEPLIQDINKITISVRSGFVNLNELTRFINSHKYNVDFDLYLKLSKQLDNYKYFVKLSYLDCEKIERKIGDDFIKL